MQVWALIMETVRGFIEASTYQAWQGDWWMVWGDSKPPKIVNPSRFGTTTHFQRKRETWWSGHWKTWLPRSLSAISFGSTAFCVVAQRVSFVAWKGWQSCEKNFQSSVHLLALRNVISHLGANDWFHCEEKMGKLFFRVLFSLSDLSRNLSFHKREEFPIFSELHDWYESLDNLHSCPVVIKVM